MREQIVRRSKSRSGSHHSRRRSPSPRGVPLFRPYDSTVYQTIMRDRDVVFLPSNASKCTTLPTFSFAPMDSVPFVTSTHHSGPPFRISMVALMPTIRSGKTLPVFAAPNLPKEDFVILLRDLHPKMKSLQAFVQERILSTVVKDVVGTCSKVVVVPSTGPLIDLSDEALTQEHYSPSKKTLTSCEETDEEEEIESALKDEYNTFDFLALMRGSPSDKNNNINDDETNKSTQLSKSWNRKRYRKAATLTLAPEGLLFEFTVGKEAFKETFLLGLCRNVTVKFEEAVIPISPNTLNTIFSEIGRILNADTFRAKVDLVFKDTKWKILSVHLPTFGFPECQLGALAGVQVTTERDAQMLIRFDDGSLDTLWLSGEDAIDLAHVGAPNSVDTWPSYFKEHGKWPSQAGVIRNKDGKWRGLYFPTGEEEPFPGNTLGEALRLMKKKEDWGSFCEEYIRVLRLSGVSKESTLLPVLSEFLNFINIPPVAHEEMLNRFMLSRNVA